jgi:zinc transport system substrate-binding protein
MSACRCQFGKPPEPFRATRGTRGATVGVIGALFLCALVAARARSAVAGDTVRVTVSIYPLELVVRALGGDRVGVETVLPPGASPHTFQPLPGDVARLHGARYVVRIGGSFDDWAGKLLSPARAAVPTTVVLDLDGIELISQDSDGAHAAHVAARRADPHVWLDPIIIRDVVAPALARELALVDPEDADGYRRRLRTFTAELQALDAEIRSTLGRARGRSYVAFHRTWPYFARRYGLRALAVVTGYAGEEPAPQDVARLVRAARNSDIPAILVEPQLNARVAEVIASEFGGTTVLVDPLGDPTDPGRSSYVDLMRYNARGFERALGGK